MVPPPNPRLSPVIRALWAIVEDLYRQKIRWEFRPGLGSAIELGSRVDLDGAPIIGYQETSVVDDLSVSHELLHLWRFGCGVPVVNTGIDKQLQGQLTYIQNQFEHLWIYSVQEAPPIGFAPWNKPHSRSTVRGWIEPFKPGSGSDMSWGIACDVNLSRPREGQVFLKEAAAAAPGEVEKAEEILRLWTFDRIDSAGGAAATYSEVLDVMGLFALSGVRWQLHDEQRKPIFVPFTTHFSEQSLSKPLVKELAKRK